MAAAEETGPVTGLLVDWGGVLTTDIFSSFEQFCAAEGLEPTTVRDAFRSDPRGRQALEDLETGALDEDGFAAAFAPVIGVASPVGLVDRLFGGMGADAAMVDAVRAARRAGVRTGLISNSWGVDRYDRELLDELFDGVVLSGEVGLRKPHADIYLLGAEAIDRLPEECVFVDDLGGNLKPARALGMTTVLHRTAAETVPQLETILGVSLR
jgi:epoxide hydrolase-like predicted phosphatase